MQQRKSEPSKPEIITEDVAEALDRAKLSDRQALKIILPVMDAMGQDPADVPISRSTISRKRKHAQKAIAQKIRKEFIPADPMVVHFDGKLLENPNGSGKVERLPTLVSWDGSEKLLGTPALVKGTGDYYKLLSNKLIFIFNAYLRRRRRQISLRIAA